MSARRGRPGPSAGGGPGDPGGNAGARGALLLAVAVVLGIVLLQQFEGGIDTGGDISTDVAGGSGETTTTTTRRVGLTTVPPETTTTVATRPKGEVKIVVANGSGVRGLAAATTTALKNLGYATLTPTDANAQADATSVQYVEGYEAEAREAATALTLPATAVTPLASPPVAPADLGDANILVVLGADVSSTTSSAPASTTSTTRTARP